MTDAINGKRARRFARVPASHPAVASPTAARSAKADADIPPAEILPAPPSSKIAQVLALLNGEQGATLAELMEATGWQAHTTRAALTGLRKKGHAIARSKRGDMTCYRTSTEV